MTGWQSIHTPPSHPGNVGGEVLPDEFGTEPLLGYRGWHVVDAGDGKGYALKSLHVSFIWDRQVRAFCHYQAAMFLNGKHNGNISPDPGCSCGIYAQLPEHPISEWDTAKQGKVSASGTIAMWGRIIQCERGYKAQYAEIQSPLVLDMSCVKGCERPVTGIALPGHSQLTFSSHCDEHAGAAAVTVVDATIWLKGASDALSRRYGMEVLTWA
jgi:hypothetical protein